jgi:hypothetical protein
MKFVQLSKVKPLDTTSSNISTSFTNSSGIKGRPLREFQDVRESFPHETVPLGPTTQRRIYDTDGGFRQRMTSRPVGSMYDIDLSSWRNGHVGDGQSKTYGFLAYPYHNYNINERVTIKAPLKIDFPQYDGTTSFVNDGKLAVNF